MSELSYRLSVLGYRRYSDYLASEHWQKFRAKIINKRGTKCEFCESGGTLHLHHIMYKRLGYEAPFDVVLICNECHFRVHRLAKEGKSLRRATKDARKRGQRIMRKRKRIMMARQAATGPRATKEEMRRMGHAAVASWGLVEREVPQPPVKATEKVSR